MTDTEEKTEFKLSELSDSAKETARNKFREYNLDYDWWEYVYDDAAIAGALMGIEIETVTPTKSRPRPNISFHGFCYQGDGCRYSGRLRIADMADAVAKVKAHAGEDEKLHSLAADAERIFTSIRAWLLTCKLKDEDPEWEDPLNDIVTIRSDERRYRTYIWNDEIASALQKDMDRFVSDFADWIYRRLEAEYEYQHSDEVVDQALADDLFDEFGSLI